MWRKKGFFHNKKPQKFYFIIISYAYENMDAVLISHDKTKDNL